MNYKKDIRSEWIKYKINDIIEDSGNNYKVRYVNKRTYTDPNGEAWEWTKIVADLVKTNGKLGKMKMIITHNPTAINNNIEITFTRKYKITL
jgi:hypothetical protein